MADGFSPSSTNVHPTGWINRLANGDFSYCPEGTQTVGDGARAFANWFVLTQSGNVTTSQAIFPEPGQYACAKILQASATAQRFGLAQIVPTSNCGDLRTSYVSLSGRLRFTSAANIRFALLEYQGAQNAAPTAIVADWTSTLYVPGQFFSSSYVVINQGIFSTTENVFASIPAVPFQCSNQMVNLVLFIWTEATVAQNGFLNLGLVMVNEGAAALDYEHRPFDEVREGVLTPEDFGAVGNGTTDDFNALNAWLNSGSTYLMCSGDYGTSQMLTLPPAVVVEAGGSTFKPLAQTNVWRLHGGAKLLNFPTIDVTGFAGWNSICVLFDGASYASASTQFTLYRETVAEVRCLGVTTGSGNGTGIKFATFDDGVNNQWVQNVHVTATGQGFDKAVWMHKDGSDVNRTFVNSNHIMLDWGSPLQAVVMESGHVNTYSVDGNAIHGHVESRGSSEQTVPAWVLLGQYNTVTAFQWDWVGGGGGSQAGLTLAAAARGNFISTVLDPSFITNSSTERTNVFYNNITGTYLGDIFAVAGSEIRIRSSALRMDNARALNWENAAGNAEYPLLQLTANDDLLMTGPTAAGKIVIINANNSTGQVAIRVNGSNAVTTDNSLKLFPTADVVLATTKRIDLQNSQSTVGAAGGASALPATPTGYIPIRVNGTEFVVPYYAKT